MSLKCEAGRPLYQSSAVKAMMPSTAPTIARTMPTTPTPNRARGCEYGAGGCWPYAGGGGGCPYPGCAPCSGWPVPSGSSFSPEVMALLNRFSVFLQEQRAHADPTSAAHDRRADEFHACFAQLGERAVDGV